MGFTCAAFLRALFVTFPPSLFKAYDIRGVYGRTLTVEFTHALGRAFGALAHERGEHTVAVGRDGRLSSPALAQALQQGLQAAGVAVLDVGMVTTPMLYFATHTVCSSGIQVTGSHNPRDDNGFKMVLQGQALYGAAIADVQARMNALDRLAAPLPVNPGTARAVDVWSTYCARIVQDIRLQRPLKVVLDCGSGVAGASAPAVLRAIGCEVVELYCAVDGHFPHHHPDPSQSANLQDLIAAVQAHGAALGVAMDGDGDRLGVVTADGQVIAPDRLLMLLAQDVLARVPGGAVVFDVKCSQQLAPLIRAAGGVPVMHATGHSVLKAKMRELRAPLGGEMSGHLFFQERWYGFDDATYAACRVLEILSRSDSPSTVLHALPHSPSTPELQLPCAEGQAHQVVARLVEQVLAQSQTQAQASSPGSFAAPAQVCTVDGLRVDWSDGFGLVRASNTTPVLTLRFEGHTHQALQRIQSAMMAALRTVMPDARLPDSAGADAHGGEQGAALDDVPGAAPSVKVSV